MQITSWANKRIVITGSSGFIGKHLHNYFTDHNAKVFGISRHKNATKNHVVIDTTDFNSLTRYIKKVSPDAIFHLASDAIVEVGQSNPYATFRNNITSALNILEISRQEKIPRIIIASSVHVYGNAPLPYREDVPARPSRPYETSKTSVDLIAQSYADTYGLPVLIPRFVNVYGPGDTNLTRIIPKTIHAIMNGDSPTLWGGDASRDYLYIDDVLHAYDVLGKVSDTKLGVNRIFNFATGKAITAKRLIETIQILMESDIPVQKRIVGRKNELLRQSVDWSKAKHQLGWEPKVRLVEGLFRTINWYLTQKFPKS